MTNLSVLTPGEERMAAPRVHVSLVTPCHVSRVPNMFDLSSVCQINPPGSGHGPPSDVRASVSMHLFMLYPLRNIKCRKYVHKVQYISWCVLNMENNKA